MIIGFFLSYGSFSPTNGIVSQAFTWKKGLEELGHEVVLINSWDKYDWKTIDAFLFYGFSVYSCEFIDILSKVNPNIYVAPILDPDYRVNTLKLYSHWGSCKLRLTNPFYCFRKIKNKIKGVLARSEFEKKYLVDGFGFKDERCTVIPLSCGMDNNEIDLNKKENFCLHISLLCDHRKNVKRLIEASKKYKFQLILAGKLRNEEEKKLLDSWINGAKNITYLGYISEEEKINLYRKAKVFALPSLNEGVGIVALEAASYGCDIVITKLGGPHEYYGNMAKIINPYESDEIGRSVCEFLNGETYQPDLSVYIKQNYSLDTISKKLIATLQQYDN